MFGSLGGPELMLIFIIGLVVFGPRKLPEIGKSLGKMIAEFKRASADFQRTVEDEVETERLRKEITSADYPASPASTPTPAAAPAEAPVIREAEGTVPTSTLLASTADMPGDKAAPGGEKSSSSS
jgi:TatA/E family protein of Tat protein translocase